MGQDLAAVRREAHKSFKEAKMPTFKYAQTVGTSFLELDLNKIDFGSIEENSSFLDFDEKEVSEKKAVVCGIQQAMLKYPDLIEKYLFSAFAANQKNHNKFTSLHMAFSEEGAFVYVPENVELKTPIIFKSAIMGQYSGVNVVIVAEKNSKITFVDISASSKNRKDIDGLKTHSVEIFAGENAKIKYLSYQNLDTKITDITNRTAILGKDSVVDWFDGCFGGNIVKSDVSTFLNGEGASVKNNSVFFGIGKQHLDFGINVVHNMPKSNSDVSVNGALKGNSRAICTGKIKITENGKKSNGNEKIKILLLDEGAEADPIPVLEIDTNDVKCSHSASVGRLQEEQVFYITSKGMSEEEAKKLIVRGFFAKALENCHVGGISREIEEKIDSLLE